MSSTSTQPRSDPPAIPIGIEHGWTKSRRFVHRACGNPALIHPEAEESETLGCETCQFAGLNSPEHFREVTDQPTTNIDPLPRLLEDDPDDGCGCCSTDRRS